MSYKNMSHIVILFPKFIIIQYYYKFWKQTDDMRHVYFNFYLDNSPAHGRQHKALK